MKTILRSCLLLLALSGLAAGSSAAERFDRTKARIDSLLSARVQLTPLPARIADPFAVSAAAAAAEPARGAPVAATPVAAPETPGALSPDEQVLALFSPALKISGHLQANGLDHLIINQSTYKEGDLIEMRGKDNSTYYLKVIRIGNNELTLGYNDAVHVVPIKP